MCRIIQRLGTFILSLLCSNMNCLFMALPRLERHCASFTFVYILPNTSLNGILFIKQYFQIKEQKICNVYSITPEARNIQACKYMQACGIHVVTQMTWKNTREPCWKINNFLFEICFLELCRKNNN